MLSQKTKIKSVPNTVKGKLYQHLHLTCTQLLSFSPPEILVYLPLIGNLS